MIWPFRIGKGSASPIWSSYIGKYSLFLGNWQSVCLSFQDAGLDYNFHSMLFSLFSCPSIYNCQYLITASNYFQPDPLALANGTPQMDIKREVPMKDFGLMKWT